MTAVRITVNGEQCELSTTVTVQEFIGQSGLLGKPVAVELNQTLVRKNDWSTTFLKDGDKIEIVQFVGGG